MKKNTGFDAISQTGNTGYPSNKTYFVIVQFRQLSKITCHWLSCLATLSGTSILLDGGDNDITAHAYND